MTPKKIVWNGRNRRAVARWDGKDRRRAPPPKRFNWTPTIIGMALVGAGIALHAVLRIHFDVVPIALIVIGGAMVDKDAVKVGAKMFSIRKNGSHDTGEFRGGL